MANRQKLIARSIVYAILSASDDGRPRRRRSFVSRVLAIFNLYWLTLQLVSEDLFRALRGFWAIDNDSYRASFGSEWAPGKLSKASKALLPMGDMGYSGSTFFRTADGAYLVKSVPRQFENSFFKNELLLPYADHMRANPASLLIRITDFLECSQRSLGTLLGLAPSHHIVMENILHGQEAEPSEGEGEGESVEAKPKWESWDLKPKSYFYPERDVAGGVLTSEVTKSKLTDNFDGKIRLNLDQAEEFKAQLQKDTKLLADCNAVDYSLFLVRISPATVSSGDSQQDLLSFEEEDEESSGAGPRPGASPHQSWRSGVTSSDGKHVYRAAILDFFWARHAVPAQAMTGLINGYNLIDEQGPMSVTTTSAEYRQRFLKMCTEIVEVEVEGGGAAAGFGGENEETGGGGGS